VPEIGLNICIPALGLPCVVTTRDLGATAGSGTASQGFQSTEPIRTGYQVPEAWTSTGIIQGSSLGLPTPISALGGAR
jgi:hypothetical protein